MTTGDGNQVVYAWLNNAQISRRTRSGDAVNLDDQDSDNVADDVDNCPTIANTDQANFDQDALG